LVGLRGCRHKPPRQNHRHAHALSCFLALLLHGVLRRWLKQRFSPLSSIAALRLPTQIQQTATHSSAFKPCDRSGLRQMLRGGHRSGSAWHCPCVPQRLCTIAVTPTRYRWRPVPT